MKICNLIFDDDDDDDDSVNLRVQIDFVVTSLDENVKRKEMKFISHKRREKFFAL